MKEKHLILLITLCFLITACQMKNQFDSKDIYKKEILETEKSFAELAKKEGLQKAFLAYADEEAVLNRNNKIIKGKAAINQYFEKQTLQDVKLDWAPDYVDVSASGDLGYTYGKYTFEAKDTSGQTITDEGVFHTVWKKQADGKWLFVWD